jgi:hypothetical protein
LDSKFVLLNINLKKLQLIISWDPWDYNIQTTKDFLKFTFHNEVPSETYQYREREFCNGEGGFGNIKAHPSRIEAFGSTDQDSRSSINQESDEGGIGSLPPMTNVDIEADLTKEQVLRQSIFVWMSIMLTITLWKKG